MCSEHLELRKEILTLLNLQKQVMFDAIPFDGSTTCFTGPVSPLFITCFTGTVCMGVNKIEPL